MTVGEIAAYVTSGVTLVGLILVYLNSRRANKTNEKKVSVEEHQAMFGANLELNKYIDARVKEQVAEQVAARVEPLEDELAKERTEKRTLVKAFIGILQSISNQNPADHPGYIFDPADVAAVEQAFPVQWLPKRRAS